MEEELRYEQASSGADGAMRKARQIMKAKTILPLVITLFFTSTGYAQFESYHLPEIVVTATRTRQSLKNTPAIMSVITREDLDRMNAKTLKEALANQIGVLVNPGDTGTAVVSIRGTTERHNLILIDGKNFAHDLDRKFNYGKELDRISLDNVERIEIVRGSYSTMYGSEAIGGVINLITKKKAPTQASVYWHKTQGHDKSNTKGFSLSGNIKDKLSLSVGGALKKTDPNYHAKKNLPYQYSGSSDTYYLNSSYEFSPGKTLSFDVDYLDQNQKRKTKGSFGGPVHNRFYDHDRLNMSLEYKAENEKEDYFLRTYSSDYKKTAYLKKLDGTPMKSSYTAYMKNRLNVLEGQYRRNIGKHTLTVGAQYRQDKPVGNRQKAGGTYIGTQTVNTFQVPLYKVSLTQKSIYLQNEWKPDEKWLFLAGARYDMHNKFANKLSPNVGVVYHISPDSRIKANYGEGYAVPGVNELYLYWGGIYGDPTLKPEASKSFDLSYELEKGVCNHKLTFFHNHIKNFIDLYNKAPSDPFGAWYYQNIAEVKLHGFEYENKIYLNKHWDARLGAMLLHSNDSVIDGQSFYAPTYRSHTRFDVGLNYHTDDLGISLWGNFIGRNKDEDDSFSYPIWNLTVNKKFGKNLEASAGFYNLFNKKADERYEFGRSFRLTLTAKV